MTRFLWLDGIFDERTVTEFPAMSPAKNFWQREFVNALKSKGHYITTIGFPVEQVWPFGRLLIHGKQATLAKSLDGSIVGYINVPFLRNISQYRGFVKTVKQLLASSEKVPDYTITYSCLNKSTDRHPSISTAKYIRKTFGIPWLCIVADGAAPPDADGYVYLTWSYYDSLTAPVPKLHIDGGVPDIKPQSSHYTAFDQSTQVKILMYMGALTPHGGVTQLAKAFQLIQDQNVELLICGRGENPEIERLAEVDKRIKIMGFVSESELNTLACKAIAFVNPRPSDFEPNKLNYPSKLLHYLAFGKPVISTFTDGISPEYADILIPVNEETECGLSEAIRNVLNMPEKDYNFICTLVNRFKEQHTWGYQVDRFVSWINGNI